MFVVYQGLTGLLDNPLSHPFLKPILPEIRNAFHDVSEKVRLAMMDLLMKVKTLRTIKVRENTGAWIILFLEKTIVNRDFPTFLKLGSLKLGNIVCTRKGPLQVRVSTDIFLDGLRRETCSNTCAIPHYFGRAFCPFCKVFKGYLHCRMILNVWTKRSWYPAWVIE